MTAMSKIGIKHAIGRTIGRDPGVLNQRGATRVADSRVAQLGFE